MRNVQESNRSDCFAVCTAGRVRDVAETKIQGMKLDVAGADRNSRFIGAEDDGDKHGTVVVLVFGDLGLEKCG